mmetsp:Transcript_16477/g.16174  ORF Transcript_16477/g.16174 Transcript_16477/m.16174 type:complete len:156 (+) Transcript_16477:729-1196(+)
MHLKRKDASSVAMNGELIYVFGGSSPEENTIDTIEKYNIKNNEWEIIPCKLPFFMSSQITLRVSSRTILILGGNIIGKDGYVRRSPKVFRLFTDTNFLQEEVPLPKPALSIYPGFVDNTNLMIVDEDSNYEQPSIVVYSIALFIPGFTSDQENTE